MKDDNYIVIQGFMRNRLNLKGNELMVYALIYGFSQDGESAFTGSVGYIAGWIGATKQTVHNTLKSLVDKGLLNKQEEYRNGIKFCTYRSVLLPVKKFDGGVVKNFDGGSQKIRHNNIVDNTNNHNIDLLADVPESIKDLFSEWVDMRKSIKKPVKTKGTVTRALNELNRLSQDIAEQRKIIGRAIDRNWLGFYPLDDKKAVKSANKPPEPPKYRQFEPDEKVDAVEMPQELREKYKGFIGEL